MQYNDSKDKMNYYIYIIILSYILHVLSKNKIYKKFQRENITKIVKQNKLEEISNQYSKMIHDEIEKQLHKKHNKNKI